MKLKEKGKEKKYYYMVKIYNLKNLNISYILYINKT